ncbi:MAG: hypothetical protein JWQ73_3874 [Variovorax sp.]|nr:hypothetical protein [Variovorax sp.]
MFVRCTLPENAVAIDSSVMTAQERLAMSRRALVNQLQGGRSDRSGEANDDNEAYVGKPHRAGLLDRFAWTSMAKRVGQRWWRRHPANTVGQLAQPLLEHYAREQPFKLVAIATAAGAVLVLVKPWRLLSVTAVLAAIMKTSDIADVVNTLMQTRAEPPDPTTNPTKGR